jgi:N-acetylglucosaminyl-diphospho-decaprenol L-rhamnosyltransferase
VSDRAADSIAVVVVTHNSAGHLGTLLASLTPMLQQGDELLLVDNASHDGSAEVAESHHATVLQTGQNLGFAGGCSIGVDATEAPLILLLNPDARLHTGCLEALRAAAAQHPLWAAWQAAVLIDEHRINSAGGVVHYLGIGWAGQCEAPSSDLPQGDIEVPFPSGAALMVRRTAWHQLGGFDPDYFMYAEDLDLGLRLWLAGKRVGLVPSARVLHDYDFHKGSAKWFWLERNRWRTVLSVYPSTLLALILPALAALELALLPVAASQGWLGAKVRAQVAVAKDLPKTLARRRRVQRSRRVSALEFASHLTADLDSPYLNAARHPLLRWPQAFYWGLVLRALRLLD